MNPLHYGFFQDLEFDVLEHWDKTGADAWSCYSIGRNNYLAEPVKEYTLKDWAKDVLADPNKCLLELGYNAGDFATYIADCTRRGY